MFNRQEFNRLTDEEKSEKLTERLYPKFYSILDLAIIDGDVELVKYFLSIGSRVNPWEPHIRSPLVVAIRANNLELVELFLNNGAYVDKGGSHYMDPSPMAQCAIRCRKGRLDIRILDALVERNAPLKGVFFAKVVPMEFVAKIMYAAVSGYYGSEEIKDFLLIDRYSPSYGFSGLKLDHLVGDSIYRVGYSPVHNRLVIMRKSIGAEEDAWIEKPYTDEDIVLTTNEVIFLINLFSQIMEIASKTENKERDKIYVKLWIAAIFKFNEPQILTMLNSRSWNEIAANDFAAESHYGITLAELSAKMLVNTFLTTEIMSPSSTSAQPQQTYNFLH